MTDHSDKSDHRVTTRSRADPSQTAIAGCSAQSTTPLLRVAQAIPGGNKSISRANHIIQAHYTQQDSTDRHLAGSDDVTSAVVWSLRVIASETCARFSVGGDIGARVASQSTPRRCAGGL